MKLEFDFSFNSKCRCDFDDVTMVQLVSNDFINRRFMISIRLYVDHVSIMIAKPYRAFEAFCETCSKNISFLETDALFEDNRR